MHGPLNVKFVNLNPLMTVVIMYTSCYDITISSHCAYGVIIGGEWCW